MKIRLDRIADCLADATVTVSAPGLPRSCDRCEARRRDGEDLRAAIAGELPDDHPMSRYVAAWRRARGGAAGGAR